LTVGVQTVRIPRSFNPFHATMAALSAERLKWSAEALRREEEAKDRLRREIQAAREREAARRIALEAEAREQQRLLAAQRREEAARAEAVRKERAKRKPGAEVSAFDSTQSKLDSIRERFTRERQQKEAAFSRAAAAPVNRGMVAARSARYQALDMQENDVHPRTSPGAGTSGSPPVVKKEPSRGTQRKRGK